MKIQIKKYVITASHKDLTNSHYVSRLRISIANMGISRRKWPDYLADVIYNYDGQIFSPDGKAWNIPDIDDVIGDLRWISTLIKQIDGKFKHAELRKIEALRLFDLCFRIAHPNIARHFGR